MEKWVDGYCVEIDDWFDSLNFCLGITYYKPGQSLKRPPAKKRSFLIPYSEYSRIMDNISTVANGLMMPDVPQDMILSEWINGKLVIRNGTRV